MNYTKEQIDKASGFGRPQISVFPFILKFMAAESAKAKSPVKNFVLIDTSYEKLKATILGEKIEVVMMIRGQFRLKKNNLISNLVVNARAESEVKIYKVDKIKNKRTLHDIGKWKEMKEKYGLSTQQIPFVNYEDKIAKLIVLPSSLSNYWEYLNSFEEEDRPFYYTTILQAEDEPTMGEGGEYYKMSFTLGKKLDQEIIDSIQEDIIDLRSKIDINEKAYQVKQEEYENEPQIIEDTETEIPEDEEIDVKDIL